MKVLPTEAVRFTDFLKSTANTTGHAVVAFKAYLTIKAALAD
jgi:hypothetical protein